MTEQRATYQAGPDRSTYLNRVHIGNALELAEALPAESIHCIVTSPPYLGLRDYGLPPFDWPVVEYAPMPGLPPVRVEAWRGCLGLEPDPFMYVGHLVAIFRALRRALRSDGTAWVNLGDSYASSGAKQTGRNDENPQDLQRRFDQYGTGRPKASLENNNRTKIEVTPSGLKPKDIMAIPWRAALALQADGWWLRSDVIWHKPNPMPESVTDRPTKAHEYLFLLSKSERYFYDAEAVKETQTKEPGSITARSFVYENGNSDPKGGGYRGDGGLANRINTGYRNRRSVWTVATRPYSAAHFATYPPALIEPCILASTSERGCCPTCGAPWVRVVEREPMKIKRSNRREAMGEFGRTQASGTMVSPAVATTTGFRPACDCPTADPVPCVVLDPFIGSGTTAQVAIEHRRHWIGFEANPDYAGELVSERLNGTQVRLL